MPRGHRWLYILFIVIWTFLAIHPKYPQDWLLENVLVFISFPLVVWLDYRYRFTLLSMILLLVFACLHELGAHFTYAEMRFFDPITHFFHLARNDFDRVVHFLYGLIVFRPMFEILARYACGAKSALLFTFAVIVAISGLYEILEWAATMIFHPDLGIAFLGIQGDIWDAQKDMLCAIVGATINTLLLMPLYLRFYEKIPAKSSSCR